MVGYCQCGCGGQTNVIQQTEARAGLVRGEYRRYIYGHNTRRFGWTETDCGYETACWNWRNTKSDRYGRIKVRGRDLGAHRFIYEEMFGPVPSNMCVCHRCDNPPCINPEHLFLGTHLDNARDKMEKGRYRSNPPRRIPWEVVQQIRVERSKGRTFADIGAEFGVSVMHTYNIATFQLRKVA